MMTKIISLIIGIILVVSFIFVLSESLKQKRPITIWLFNCFNLSLGILNIALFFQS